MDHQTQIDQLLAEAHRFWLMKTEPGECSIQDVLADAHHRVSWFGIRNYQARNFMRDDMRIGDGVLFYHSSCPQPGIVGLARISSQAYPDELQFDPQSEYFDPKSSPEKPRWLTIDVEALFECPVIALSIIRQAPELSNMRILQKGNRLSITPVSLEEFRFITTSWMT